MFGGKKIENELTPEQLEDRQQQDRDRRAEMTPERLEFRQQLDHTFVGQTSVLLVCGSLDLRAGRARIKS